MMVKRIPVQSYVFPDIGIEQIGMLIWMVGVLICGLHCLMMSIVSPIAIEVLMSGSRLLQWIGIGFVALGVLRALASGVRRRFALSRARPAPQPLRHGRFQVFGVECLLAALLIQTTFALATDAPGRVAAIVLLGAFALFRTSVCAVEAKVRTKGHGWYVR